MLVTTRGTPWSSCAGKAASEDLPGVRLARLDQATVTGCQGGSDVESGR